MDFIFGLPRTPKGHDAIWVIIDRLTKSTHFLAINNRYSLERLTQLRMSLTYHPQTDGQSKRTIQSLEDFLGVYVLDEARSRDSYLPLIDLKYNNNNHTRIRIAPESVIGTRSCGVANHGKDQAYTRKGESCRQ